jgi:hypothetical protein
LLRELVTEGGEVLGRVLDQEERGGDLHGDVVRLLGRTPISR